MYIMHEPHMSHNLVRTARFTTTRFSERQKGGVKFKEGSRHEGVSVFEVKLLEPVFFQFFETLPQFFSMKYPQLVCLIQEA